MPTPIPTLATAETIIPAKTATPHGKLTTKRATPAKMATTHEERGIQSGFAAKTARSPGEPMAKNQNRGKNGNVLPVSLPAWKPPWLGFAAAGAGVGNGCSPGESIRGSGLRHNVRRRGREIHWRREFARPRRSRVAHRFVSGLAYALPPTRRVAIDRRARARKTQLADRGAYGNRSSRRAPQPTSVTRQARKGNLHARQTCDRYVSTRYSRN